MLFFHNSLFTIEPETLRSAYYDVPQTVPCQSRIGIATGYDDKVAYHKRKGAEAFCEAESMCAFLERNICEKCFALFDACVELSAVTPLSGWAQLVQDLSVQLSCLGVYQCAQGDMIRERLADAEYHYGLAIYYYNKG